MDLMKSVPLDLGPIPKKPKKLNGVTPRLLTYFRYFQIEGKTIGNTK